MLVADKSNFTPDEWKLLLESVMVAGIVVTAADPGGFLREIFASNSELVKVRMDPGANPLIKAVVSDFGNAEERSTTRDVVKEKLRNLNPADIPAKCIETLRRSGAVVDAKVPADVSCFQRLAAPHQPTGGRGGPRNRWRAGKR
jgi:hypothetical protein